MKKYMIVALVPILLQGALLQSSEAEFNQAIAPSLQNARGLLKNSMISADLDSVLNGFVASVQNGTISKEAGLSTMNGIKNALEAYKNRQYSNSWLSWFVSTPQIVKDKVQPSIDKVNNAIAVLNSNELSSLAIAGIVGGSVVGAAALGTAVYAGYQWHKGKGKRQFDQIFKGPLDRSAARMAEREKAAAASTSSSSVSSGDYDEDDAEEDAQIADPGFTVATLPETSVQHPKYYDQSVLDLPLPERLALSNRVHEFSSIGEAMIWARQNSKHAQAFLLFYNLNQVLRTIIQERPEILDQIKERIKPSILKEIQPFAIQ